MDVHVSNGRIMIVAHDDEIEELLSQLELEIEPELRSLCG